MCTFNLFLNKSKIDKNGQAPVLLVCTVKEQKFRWYTGIKVTPKHWDLKTQRCTKYHKYAVSHNQLLDELMNKIEGLRLQLRGLYGHNISLDIARNAAKPILWPEPQKQIPTVREVLREYIIRCGKERSESLAKKFNTLDQELQAIEITTGAIQFSSFNNSILDKYRQYLFEVKNNNDRTIHKKLDFLLSFLTWASKRGYKAQVSLNEIVSVAEPKEASHHYLSWDELMKLNSHVFESARLDHARDCFVFACFTGL